MHLSKRRLIILASSLISLALIVGVLLYIGWYSEGWAEQRLQDYIGRLEDSGFTAQEHSLADFHVNGTVRIQFFSDFRSIAEQEGIKHIYYDRKIDVLYFLRSTQVGTEANVFYYK